MIPNKLSDLAAGAFVQHWLTLGPFVVKTSDHFEREYLYERDRILDIDYLAEDGGEITVAPEAGRTHDNIGLGPKTLSWQAYDGADLRGLHVAGDLIYETVQRNCIVYAAAAIEAEAACVALLDAYHSGMKAWMNGELVCNEPYGLTKGIRLTMPSKVVSLRQGRNLLLIKFRPGYICDGIDFRVRNVALSPMVGQRGLPIAIGRVHALPYFRGSVDAPRQVLEAAILNTSHVADKVTVAVSSETLGSEESCDVVCDPQRVTTVRLSLATPRAMAGKPVQAVFRARLYGRTVEVPIEYQAAEPPKYDGTMLVLTSFHFDTTYHEEQRVYAMGAFDIMRRYCQLHREDPHFRSTLSEIDYLKPYFDVFPEDRETLLKAFREKRAEPDVMYNQPNEQNCDGEALVRNFLYGQLFHGRVLGNICHVYGPGDVFGHPNQLSQIARKSGCIGISWDKHIYNFPPFFTHLALDGIGLPHKRGWASWDDVHQMGLSVTTGGIDQTPPTDWHATLLPKVQQATYGDLVSAIKRDCSERGAHLPVVTRDMALYHAATSMSRIELKIGNRLGENTLIAAEKFATIANLLGAKYPEKALDKAWRQILCGQHHDSITGTHNEISYIDLMNSYRETVELASDVLHRSLDYLGRAIDAGGADRPLVVFNSLAWERTDLVRTTLTFDGIQGFALQDHEGRNVPFEVAGIRRNKKGLVLSADVAFVANKLPSLGYRAYRVVLSNRPLPEPKRIGGTVIENEFYRIEVDPARGGGIVSLYDKQARREVMNKKSAHVGNELAVLQEVPDRPETQHEFYTTGLKVFSSEYPAKVEIEKGPVTTTLRSRCWIGEICGAIQEITLTAGIKRIDFRTILLDWQGEDYLFCVTFPTSLKGCVPVFDERFGAVVRNDSQGYLDFRTHRQVMFSNCAVYAANKWMEQGSSAILQAGKNKYALGMIGMITPKNKQDLAIAEHVMGVLIKKGITCTPWFDEDGPHWGSYLDHRDEDLLYTRFRFSIGSGGKNAYSQKLLSAQPAGVRRDFERRLKRDGVACLLVKDAALEDASWPPLPVLIIEGWTPKTLAAGIEGLLADFASTATIRLPAEADATGERHTVDNYGVAMINQGTSANSIEKGGVLCMMLSHTCRWYGATNNFPEGYLVPENKHHVYQYALYPHAGTWREAGTQRVAHEFNHELLAKQTKPVAKPCLPAELAFVEVSPKNLIVTAMKPFGNPIAAFEKNAVCDASTGIMLRFYDTEGVDTTARVAFASGIKAAWSANLIEERQGDLPIEEGTVVLPAPAFSIETVGLVPAKLGRKMGAATLGVECEPVQPVWVRSWEHDAESMPMGYQPVVCSISREVREEDDGRTLVVKLNAVNDYTDAAVAGSADILVPEGWVVEPPTVRYDLAPLGHQVTTVRVTRPDGKAAGQIKLRYVDGGQTFQDVLEIGASYNLNMDVENRGDRIVVSLANPTCETIEGEVAIVTPVETWPAELAGRHALLEIAPRTQGVSLAPGATAALEYVVRPATDSPLVSWRSYWAVAKLMSNGRIQLKLCGDKPPRRLMDDAKWHRMLEEKAHRRLRARGKK